MTAVIASQLMVEAVKDGIVVRNVSRRELIQLLIDKALETQGQQTITVEYLTDMLDGKKTRASARAAFPNGLFRHVRATVNVGFDYAAKVEKRTDGEETAKGGNWSQAVVIGERITPLSVHKADVLTLDPLTVKDDARAYLRYDLLTKAQEAANFGKKDFSLYVDKDGNHVPEDAVKPHQPPYRPGVVEFRLLGLANVLSVRFGGMVYHQSRTA
jgi:hypothetical protein